MKRPPPFPPDFDQRIEPPDRSDRELEDCDLAASEVVTHLQAIGIECSTATSFRKDDDGPVRHVADLTIVWDGSPRMVWSLRNLADAVSDLNEKIRDLAESISVRRRK